MNVHHYSSLDKFKSMLIGKKFWLTPIDGTTDEAEMIHLYKKSWVRVKERLFKRGINIYTPMFGMLEDQISNVAMYSYKPYLLCFSMEEDLLSQWREYGDGACGISLEVNLDYFNVSYDLPHPNVNIRNAVGIAKAIYDYDRQDDIIEAIVLNVIKQASDTALDWLTIMTNFKHYSGVYKNKTFYEEKEVRMIYYGDKDHQFSSNFISGPFKYRDNLDRYEISWYTNAVNHAIKSITLGSKCIYTESDMKKLLEENSVVIDVIKKSESTYR